MVFVTRQRAVLGTSTSERLRLLIEFLASESGLAVFKRTFTANMAYKVDRYTDLLRELEAERRCIVDTLDVKVAQLKGAANVDGDADNWPIFESVSGEFRDVTERVAKFETLRAAAQARVGDVASNAPALREELLTALRALAVHDAQVHIVDRVADLVGSFLKDPVIFRSKPLNLMLVGSAGSGKTTLAAAIGVVFARAGLFAGDRLILAGRAELVAQYEGQTVARTRSFLTSHLDGGVVFIDEAYSITPWSDGRCEGYGAEAATAMVEFMTRYHALYCLIIAGYEKHMCRYFLPSNEGMARRFPYKFVLKNLSTQELVAVFQMRLSLQMRIEDASALFRSCAWRYLSKIVRAAMHGVVQHVEEYDPATRRKYSPVQVFVPALPFLHKIFENQAGSMVTLAEEAVQVLLAKQPFESTGRYAPPGEETMKDVVEQRIYNCALSGSDLYIRELREAERA